MSPGTDVSTDVRRMPACPRREKEFRSCGFFFFSRWPSIDRGGRRTEEGRVFQQEVCELSADGSEHNKWAGFIRIGIVIDFCNF